MKSGLALFFCHDRMNSLGSKDILLSRMEINTPMLQYSLAQTWILRTQLNRLHLRIIAVSSEYPKTVAPGRANTPECLFQSKPIVFYRSRLDLKPFQSY
jgi:hypothetical protein